VHYRRVCIFSHHSVFTLLFLVVDGLKDWLRKSRSYTHVIWWLMYPHFQSLIFFKGCIRIVCPTSTSYTPHNHKIHSYHNPTLSNCLRQTCKGITLDYMFTALFYMCVVRSMALCIRGATFGSRFRNVATSPAHHPTRYRTRSAQTLLVHDACASA
jgi:hypothetical protein